MGGVNRCAPVARESSLSRISIILQNDVPLMVEFLTLEFLL